MTSLGDEIMNALKYCIICFCDDDTEVMCQSPSLKNNPDRKQLLQKVFGALPSFQIFEDSALSIHRICGPCDHNLETTAAFIEDCVRAQQILTSQIKVEFLEEEEFEEKMFPEGTVVNLFGALAEGDDAPSMPNDCDPDHAKLHRRKRKQTLSTGIIMDLVGEAEFEDNMFPVDEKPLKSNDRDSSPNRERLDIKKRKQIWTTGNTMGLEEPESEDKMLPEGGDCDTSPYPDRPHRKKTVKLMYCDVCDKRYKSAARLAIHRAAHENDAPAPFPCSVCSETFSRITALKRHETKHGTILKETCRICRLKFENKLVLLQHKKEFHQLQIDDDEIDKAGDLPVRQVHEPTEEPMPKLHRCGKCKAVFQSLELCKQHISDNHFDEQAEVLRRSWRKVFVCSCGDTYRSVQELKIHQLRRHQITSKFAHMVTCPECNKVFSTPANLQRHLNIHKGVKPFLCGACPAAFYALSALKIHERRLHLRIPTTPPPRNPSRLLCDLCGRAFDRKRSLLQHFSIRHSLLDRIHHCSFPGCSKSFAFLGMLKRHEKYHKAQKQFVCEFCDKGFKTSRQCQSHKNYVHLNVRPFKCDTCQVRFKNKAHLVKHIRTHTGDRPFPCPKCSYRCAVKSNLSKHMKVHFRDL